MSHRRSPVPPVELAVAGVLLAIAAAAWAWTIPGMAGMDAGLWSHPTGFGPFMGTWAVMTTAMMLPSIVPAVLRAISGHRGQRTAFATAGVLAGGYLAVWVAAGLVPYALLSAGDALASGSLMGGTAGRYLAVGVLTAAVAYQFAPPKRACLGRLCAPLPLAREVLREGPIGALRTGLEAGGWCLGCCWALMVSLLALGSMRLTWMVLIWILVMAERLAPSRRLAVAGVATILAALAAGLLLGAPIATIPQHGGAPM